MKRKMSLKDVWRGDKELKICIADLEFELERTSLVRAWDSWGHQDPQDAFSRKCNFLKSKKRKYYHWYMQCVFVFVFIFFTLLVVEPTAKVKKLNIKNMIFMFMILYFMLLRIAPHNKCKINYENKYMQFSQFFLLVI